MLLIPARKMGFYQCSGAFKTRTHPTNALSLCDDVGCDLQLIAPTNFHVRKISGNYNTNFDWQGGINGSIAVDGENIGTPNTGFFRGGTVALYANKNLTNPTLGTEATFYYWGGDCNGSMNYSSNSYQ